MEYLSLLSALGAEPGTSGATVVPNLLLSSVRKLDLTDAQLVLIVQILRLSQEGEKVSLKLLAQNMAVDQVQIGFNLKGLSDRGLIRENGAGFYSLEPLVLALSDIWATEKKEDNLSGRSRFQAANSQPAAGEETMLEDKVNQLTRVFEKELGRIISPLERELIMHWARRHESVLIMEAFRMIRQRGVTRSIKPLDGLLLEWESNGLRSLYEVHQYESTKAKPGGIQRKPRYPGSRKIPHRI